MKNLIILFISSFPFVANAQPQITVDSSGMAHTENYKLGQFREKPFIFLNGMLIDLTPDIESRLHKKLGAILIESDSSWAATYFSDSSRGFPIIDEYLKLKNNYSAWFLFTKDRVEEIRKKELRGYLNKKGNYLFKFDSSPMSKDPALSKKQYDEIKRIRRVKNFTLKKWDTGKVDTFDLFIISTSNSNVIIGKIYYRSIRRI